MQHKNNRCHSKNIMVVFLVMFLTISISHVQAKGCGSLVAKGNQTSECILSGPGRGWQASIGSDEDDLDKDWKDNVNNRTWIAIDQYFEKPDPDLDPDGYPNSITRPDDLIKETSAQLMWYWDDKQLTSEPTGKNGPNVAYFRYDLGLLSSDEKYESGSISILADDYFKFYINGDLAGEGSLDNYLGNKDTYPNLFEFDLTLCSSERPTACLNPSGRNVLGIIAADGYSLENFAAHDLVYEYLFVDGGIVVTVAEPISWYLFGVGFIGLLAFKRNVYGTKKYPGLMTKTL